MLGEALARLQVEAWDKSKRQRGWMTRCHLTVLPNGRKRRKQPKQRTPLVVPLPVSLSAKAKRKALRNLKRKQQKQDMGSKFDMMNRGRRLPGSFESGKRR